MSYIATRNNVGFGEGVKWAPPEGAASFFVWVKHTSVDSAMRWRRVAGWDVANNVVIPVAIPVGAAEFRVSRAEVVLNWEALLSLFDGYDPEILQFTTHADETADSSALRTRDVYLLPPPASTNAASIAALERRFLGQLLEMRAGLGALAGGHVSVKTPDGTEVERMPIAVVDRRVAEVRARIAWFEQAARGNAWPRAEFW